VKLRDPSLTRAIPEYLTDELLIKLYTNKCINKGLMLVAAWCRWTPKPKLVKFGEQMSIGPTPNTLRLHRNKKCARYLALKIFAFRKVDQSSPQSLKTCYAPVPPLSLILLYLAKRCMRNVVQEFFMPVATTLQIYPVLGQAPNILACIHSDLAFLGP